MSLPVSHYEDLLAEVRGLRRKAERVQQLAQPLIVGTRSQRFQNESPLDYTMESLLAKRQHNTSDNSPNYDQRSSGSEQDRVSSGDECRLRDRASRSQMSVSSEPVPNQTPIDSMYHGAWPNVPRTLWNSEPASLGKTSQSRKNSTAFDGGYQNEVASVMSFASSSGGAPIDSALCNAGQKWSSQQLEAKMDVVNSLLSMLGSQEHVDMGETLLALSTCQESCLAMRQSGCIPLLVQLVQSDKDNDTRKKAAHALHNLVNSQSDEQIRKRELRILKLLEDVRQYIECLKYNMEFQSTTLEPAASPDDDGDRHPVQTIAHLMKLSFDEGHRQAICLLGGIYTTATLVETEHTLHGNAMQNGNCILMRRYACMTLTNLTFGDSGNKTLLCSFKEFMRNLVQQLQSPSDELRQVTASVLRNLSWRADSTSKEILREVGSVTGLMKAAMTQNKENTLKSILSALWNLSAHCTENKSEICGVEKGLGFIVNMLTYKTPSKSLAIIENAGGILRNISSQIAVREDYREILRQHNCLHILLEQLKSPSLTIVSNACGTLWNLSAKNAHDQDALWQMGAPAMLRSLNHSKHKMIAMGSSAALKNLISCRPQQSLAQKMDSTALALNLPELPTLGARKQKALLQDLDQNLSETYENIDKDSPVKSNATTGAAGFLAGNRATLTSPEHFVNAFASLNLNEPSTSYGTEFRPKSKIPQNFGGSSLPYVPQSNKRSNPASFLPVRTKFSDHSYEDDTPEQPIDYSQKYSETRVETKRSPIGGSPDLGQTENNMVYPDQKEVNFAMEYTETDLDQPTDYSLRYADDDSYSDICGKITKQEFVQDTVKTYCTEGTPYETPFVFSNATSMSDLRNVGNMDDKPEIDNDIQKDLDKKDNKETKHVDEKDRCSTEDISEMENTPRKPQKSEFSSGMMSPEKPVNYCEEGTPGYFSRVSSFSSDLDSIQVKQEASVGLEQKTASASRDKVSTAPKTPNEAKVVKFEQVVNYAEQTPLMFSRSSSLASLDSIEQHSIHDDRSSVVSDFSRLTSGIVSPSELPDSPTQTVPSSPRSSKGKLGFPHSSKQLRDNKQRLPLKSSVFEDNTTKFKEEDTPLAFSTATSLSSLTIDDHEDPGNASSSSKTPDTKVLQPPERRPCLGAECELYDQQGDQPEKKDIEKADRCEDSSDLDDDLLAACINDGIQSNISAPTASTAPTMLPMPSYKYQHMKMPGGTGIPLMRRTPPRHLSSTFPSDVPRTYCTEDTPAELSRAGSRSNLSTLSIPNDAKSKVGDFSDDSSNLDEESEQLLAECIQMGMPKPVSEIKGFHSNSLGVPQDNKSKAADLSDDSSTLSEDNEKLLQECIESGMPKPKTEFYSYHSSLNSVLTCKDNRTKSGEISEDSGSNISVDSEKLLQECIESAMPKPITKGFHSNLSISDPKPKPDISSDDSDGERLLQECIELGMPQPKPESQFSGFRSALSSMPISKDNRSKCGDLSDDSGNSLNTEQELIGQECIEAGMPAPPTQQKRDNDVPSANLIHGSRKAGSLATETGLKMQKDDALPKNPDGNLLKQMPRQPQAYSKLRTLPIPVGNKAKAAGDISDDSCSSLSTEQELKDHNLNLRSEPIATDRKSGGVYFADDFSSSLALDQDQMPQSKQPLKEHKLNVRGQPIDADRKSKGRYFSDDSARNLTVEEERILQECIEAGMPQRRQPLKEHKPDMRNQPTRSDRRSKGRVSSDEVCTRLTLVQEQLLYECIEAGMPRAKPQGHYSSSRSAQPSIPQKKKLEYLSDDSISSFNTEERLLLDECIAAGMPQPKSRIQDHKPDMRSQPTRSDRRSKGGYFSAEYCSGLTLDQQKKPNPPGPYSSSKSVQPSIPQKNKLEYLSDHSISSFNTEDRELLDECIAAGMPQPKSQIQERKADMRRQPTRSDRRSKGGYFSDDSCSHLTLDQEKRPKPQGSYSSSRSVQSSIPQKNKLEYLSDHSISSFNTEDRELLDECIAAGMPQPKSQIQAPSDQLRGNSSGVLPRRPSQPIKQNSQLRGDQKLARKSGESLKPPQSYSHNRQGPEHHKIDNRARRFTGREANMMRERREMSLPAYFSTMKDELARYQEEDSPSQFSLRSSLSDLTVDGSVAGVTPSVRQHNVGLRKEYDTAGPSRAPLGSDNRAPIRDKQSRHSFSSVSSTEEDRALLQECINVGMSSVLREDHAFNRPRVPQTSRDVLAIAARSAANAERRHERSELPRGTDPVSRSKNVNAASVAESTAVTPLIANEQRLKMSIQVADVEKSVAQDGSVTEKCGSSAHQTTDHSINQLEDVKPEIQPASDMSPASISATEEALSTDQTKSGSSKSGSQFLEASFENDFTFSNSDKCANLNNVFNRSCEESATLVDNRMLDPDAMIESLDRFTAELVSQASQLNKEKGNEVERLELEKSTVSNNDDSTWNEDSSQNELTFPTISGSAPNVITFDSDSANVDVLDGADRGDEGISNDFSSVNTNTMTESTLIAIEANKMVTAFKEEAELSESIASAKSLDLDSIMPPSQLNSLTGSVTGFEKGHPKSPKAVFRKKSLPGSLLVKRALSNSLNQGSSLESLYNNSLGNIEGTNPPSEMQNLGDMESSIISVASLPLEGPDINNPLEKAANCKPHPIFNVKQQFVQSTADLEMVNPPSIFNDITDMCNSLADVATEIIGTETSTFQDCLTHVPDDNTLPLDPTEFSDANSLTPIQSDFSSAETTPKRTSKSLSKSMMTKQRRNLARDRYKTYVVAAEKVMQESIEMETKERTAAEEKDSGADENQSDDYQTVNDKTEVFDSLTYTVKSGKITPKERRKMDRARFETRVLDESSVNVAKIEQSTDSRASSASPSPTRSKLSIRRNFMQKRLENKERFRTQTVSESSFGSPELSTSSPPCESNDIHSLVEKEANLVLKNIRDSKCLQDEMLDFETLSLLSNDDDSEHNSGVAVNYNTYHKSWTSNQQDAPVVAAETVSSCVEKSLPAPLDEQPAYKAPSLPDETLINSPQESEEEESKPAKSKIVKPTATEEPAPEEQPKGIRGRRKMLYSKTNVVNKVGPKTIKPAKTMVISSLVKNVTSTIKSGNAMKNVATTRAKSSPSIRPPMPSQVKSSGYGYTKSSPNRSGGNSPKHSPKATPPLERQGTFTKDDSSSSNSPKSSSRLPTPPSRIPSFARQIARAVPSKTALNNNIPSGKSNVPAKSLSADRTNKNTRLYNRSTSADSREPVKKIQASSSTHSLKNEPKTVNGALGKRSGIPSPAQRSHSNVSVASNGSVRKQVTSKIASLWKRVEESKARQFPSQDKRVWIHSESESTKPSLVLENEAGETSPSLASATQE